MLHGIERLELAKQKLQATDMPFQIRVTSYLRICCSILDQEGGKYSKLLKGLYQSDANWWQSCRISAYGGLQSIDPSVTDLLRSIEALHKVNLQPQALNLQYRRVA